MIRSSCVTRLVMTEGTRSSFRAAALKLPVFATATKARIEAIVSILHDSRKLNCRQAPFSVELARLGACPNSRCSILGESDSTLGHEQVFSPLEYRSDTASAAECAGFRAERPCLAGYR